MSANRSHFLALIGQKPGEAGRNTKYDPEIHCQLVRDMGEQGEFQEAWASAIGITVATMRDWVRMHPEFRDAVIIAHQLLITHWTRKMADHVTVKRNDAGVAKEQAIPGMFAFLMKRFPAIYGRDPIDLQAWLMEADDSGADTNPTVTQDSVRQASTEQLEAQLEALRRRRKEENG